MRETPALISGSGTAVRAGVTPRSPNYPLVRAASALWLLAATARHESVPAAELPVPCVAGGCGANAPSSWVSSGQATATQAGNTLTVMQSSANAVLNWRSFNISSDGAVTFQQPNAAAVALNQIFQSDPSKILGALSSNGSLYLINQNGIIFGSGAKVNVGSLLASSLNLTPTALAGILQAGLKAQPAFASTLDAQGNPLSGPVQVASGATLQAANGGQIMLFAPQVSNSGVIRADGGQVILAAGDSVYLAASADPNLRGLLVEVGHGGTVTNAAATSPGGSNGGQIVAADGNVTLVGLIVNQLGRVSATTGVQENGSIYLLAQDGGSAFAQPGIATATLSASRSGTLTLGPGSQTDVTPDLSSSAAAVDATAQPRSQVTLNGQQVTLASGSEITATAGNVSIEAAAVPEQPAEQFGTQPGAGRLVVDSGASIDVSGANISLPMSSNVIAVQLRGTELADSPLQRNGPLRGQTVYVDTRQSGVRADGTSWVGSPIGDLSGYVAAIERPVGERSLNAGQISLVSDGAALVASGAKLNVSGGSIDYQPGFINTTQLLGTDGKVYDISQANPLQTYVGILTSGATRSDPKWGVTKTFTGLYASSYGQYEPGYVQGADAGTVAIQAPRLGLDANITANTVTGPLQRQLPTTLDASTNPNLMRPVDQIPLSGQLILGLPDGGTLGDNYLLPDVTFARGMVLNALTGPSGAPFNPLTDPLPAALDTVQVRPNLFGEGGVGRLQLYANGTVSLPDNVALQLPLAGQLTIKSGAIDMAGTVTAHAGSVSLTATPTEAIPQGSSDATLTLTAHSSVDVSGVWVNDLPNPALPPGTDPLGLSGGSVQISASGGTPLELMAGSSLEASAGAQRSARGTITGGHGGSISISVGPSSGGTAVPGIIGSTLSAFALSQGGTLSMTANSVCVAAVDCAGGDTSTLWVPTSLFSSSGFAKISLASDLGGLSVMPGTQLAPRQSNFIFERDPATAPSGTPIASLLAPAMLPDLTRLPVSVSLAVNPAATGFVPFDNAMFASAGILNIGSGSTISLDPSGTLSLGSSSSIVVGGSLYAPAGSISIATNTSLPILEFLASQGIWLLDGAHLSTQGVARLLTNDSGQSTGSVLNGGAIAISADRGYLITAPGSSLDASGTAATLTLTQYGVGGTNGGLAPTLIGSNGGSVTLAAAEGMFLNGSVVSRAGAAPGASGGVLTITLDGNLHGPEPNPLTDLFPTINPRQLVLTSGAPVIVGPQSAIPAQLNGTADVPSSLLSSGGFSSVQLTARNLFDSGVNSGATPASLASLLVRQDTTLQLPASIRLDTPEIATPSGAKLVLQAPYVALGYDDTVSGAQTGFSSTAGPNAPNSGTLEVKANLVDLIGGLGLGGFSSTTINSAGDIRFVGIESSGPVPEPLAGQLQAQGSLVLQANQIYPATLTQFTVSVAGAPAGQNTLEILPGGSSGAVLSAGGQLTLTADAIEQAGALRAPFGQLSLNSPQITLASGSVTSTSGANVTIPFGVTQAGTDWVYPLPQGQSLIYTLTGPPTKSVLLTGNSILVAKGATIDLSGGGDLQASEFIPGVGGTVDVLSNTNAAAPGQFAIVPAMSLQYSPYDSQLQAGFSYAPGASVVLGGGGAVAAGTYAILPAAYALLPGAYLVRPVSGYQDLPTGQSIVQADGSTIVSGQFAVAGTSFLSSRTQGFDIRPGTAVVFDPNTNPRGLAQYTVTTANAFFSQLARSANTAAPPLPIDGGQLQFSAGEQLQFLGSLVASAQPGGRGAEVDISATQIEVTSGDSSTQAPGSVTLVASQLGALGAQSLLIGGTRSTSSDVTQINTTATTLTVDPGVTLTGSEIMLTASRSLSVSSGATLAASGADAPSPSGYQLGGQTPDGAFLRVSTGAQAPVLRSDSTPDPTQGALLLAQDATLKSTGSATLEASGSFQSQATYDLSGGSLALTAAQISLGAAPSGAGLVIAPQQLSSLSLSDLELTSVAAIGVFGSNTLGVAGTLSLNAPAIAAATGDASATLQAKQITLQGGTAPWSGSSMTSTGALTLQADQLILSGGTMQLAGFGATALNGSAGIRASGSGALSSDGALALHTALLATGSGVNYQISTPQSLALAGAVAPSSTAAAPAGAGGSLSLAGSAVSIDTMISLPSGALQVRATGPDSSSGINLGQNANISAAGFSNTFDSLLVAGPGGAITLNAAAGSISMAQGARIDVSAAGGGAAGSLSIATPNGAVDLEGTLLATGGSGASGGQLTLDAAQLPDLAVLNTSLNAGGFGGLRDFRQRGTGNVAVSSQGLIRANSVSIENDGGSVTILGAIDASGSAGGSVTLTAQGGVEVAGNINLAASGAGQAGGDLSILSTSGTVLLDSTAAIQMAGGAAAAGGTLTVTVPRSSLTALLTPGTPAPVILGATVSGAPQVQVEGLATYNAAHDAVAGTISANDMRTSGNWYSDATSFMASAPQIAAALQGASTLDVSVIPGIEIYSAGNLTLAANWDLSTWRFNGSPGVLSLLAGGNLLINKSLSDGFNGVTGTAGFTLPATPGPSWSYRLVAGADLSASNPLAVASGAAGSILIANGVVDGGSTTRPPTDVMVRTGTGNIQLAAAGNLQFGNQASVIYSAGEDSGQGIRLPELSSLAYPAAGGNISVDVGGDIIGAPTNQLVTNWLWRAGQLPGSLISAQSATGWTVSYQWFEENIGALAGGNVSIRAGGNISELSVAVPTIGRQVGGTSYTQNQLQIAGGGTLGVRSGGNITGGSYFIGGGSATLEAGGFFGAGQVGVNKATGLAPLLSIGDASIAATARDGLTVESVVNPFLLPNGKGQPTSAATLSFFSTYTDASAVSLVSTAGDVTLLNQPLSDAVPQRLNSMTFSGVAQEAFLVYPGTVEAAALAGDLNLDGQLTLWPSASGNLNLLAAQNVVFDNGGVLMSGLAPTSLANPNAPVQSVQQQFMNLLFVAPPAGVALTPLHADDPSPVRIVADAGNVSNANLDYIPKPVRVVAGEDVTELTLRADNINPTDLSLISARGSISYQSPRDVQGHLLPEVQSIVIEGPGSLLVEAGREVNLGTSEGVTTVGNLYNPAIAPGGASISVLAGATVANADLPDFITRYFTNSTTYDAQLIAYVQAYTTATVTSKAQAATIFATLTREQQFELCQQVMNEEIRAGGRTAAATGAGHGDYSRSFLALSTLFPNSTTASGQSAAATVYPGSVSLYFSQIYTLDGGDITLLAPGGNVDVGLATPPTAFGISKAPSQLGIVAEGTGNISSISYSDFQVNQSRVFAANGGDILVWSTDGNVDAGRGAKTAISAPAPTISFNAQGQVVTVFPQALEGSGIQALATSPGVSPGDVDLFAPQGVVNANDAGIVAGNLTIGATAVLGRDNISVSGVAVGVPVEVTGLGASLASSSSVASSAANAATEAVGPAKSETNVAPLSQGALNWLDVFLEGFGEEVCKPSDEECLKRQQKTH